MAHIHTQPGQHDLTVSAFIIRTDGPEPRAMLHVHKKLGILLQFGGHVELHEDPWQAITHELEEESGYTLGELQLLQPFEQITFEENNSVVHPYPMMLQTHKFRGLPHMHTDISFAFVANAPPQQKPQEGEATDLILLTTSELKARTDPRLSPDTAKLFLFAIEQCLPTWQKIIV